VAASRSEAATKSKDPYTSDTAATREERTLLSAAVDSDFGFDFFRTNPRRGCPSLRVLCARVGFHVTVP